MENFDLMAKDFDTDRRIERAQAISNELRMHIVDSTAKSALEYGCGTGLVGLQLIHDFTTILFVDSSPNMIEQVKQKLLSLGRPTDSAICSDFMMTVPQGLKVDYIFTSMTLHHIKDTKTILSRFFNILNNEGHLLIVDIDQDNGSFHADHPDFDGHNGFDQPALADLAGEAGFAKVDTKTFYHGSKMVSGKNEPYTLFILDAVKK